MQPTGRGLCTQLAAMLTAPGSGRRQPAHPAQRPVPSPTRPVAAT